MTRAEKIQEAARLVLMATCIEPEHQNCPPMVALREALALPPDRDVEHLQSALATAERERDDARRMSELLEASPYLQVPPAEVQKLREALAGATKNAGKAVDLALLYEKAARAARTVLREVEWVERSMSPYAGCLVCGRDQHEGHAPDCRLAAALRDTPPDGCWCEEDYQGDGLCPTCRRPANPWRALKRVP